MCETLRFPKIMIKWNVNNLQGFNVITIVQSKHLIFTDSQILDKTDSILLDNIPTENLIPSETKIVDINIILQQMKNARIYIFLIF